MTHAAADGSNTHGEEDKLPIECVELNLEKQTVWLRVTVNLINCPRQKLTLAQERN